MVVNGAGRWRVRRPGSAWVRGLRALRTSKKRHSVPARTVGLEPVAPPPLTQNVAGHAGRSLTWPYLQLRIRILMELSQRSRDIIDFERTWRALPGTKAQAIRDRFGMSDSRYYQLLNDVLDEPGVAAYDPLVVKRLRRHRERRRRARFDRQYGGSESR